MNPALASLAATAPASASARDARRRAISRGVERARGRAELYGVIADRLSLLRLGVFMAGAAATLGAGLISGGWLALTLIVAGCAFIGAVAIHRRYRYAADQWLYWERNLQTQVARMDLDWKVIPDLPPAPTAEPSRTSPEADHPFDRDLDLTGAHSVHALINTASSAEGADRLRGWLLSRDPQRATIEARQRAVRSLRHRTAFRARLGWESAPLSGRRALDAALVGWVRDTGRPLPIWSIPVLVILAILNIGLGLATLMAPVTIPALATPRAVAFALYAALYALHAGYIRDLFDDATGLGAAFVPLERVFHLIEREAARSSPRATDGLASLWGPFQGVNRPSKRLRTLNRIVAAASFRGSPFVWLGLNALVPWDLLVYSGLAQARTGISAALPGWLDAWHELEALSALANHAYLNPQSAFPEFVEGGPIFAARALGHPLIPENVRIRNDFTLGGPGEVVLITGSNMSGKSSFLRTVGVAIVLACAGGTVDARTLALQPCRLFACMRVTDSVTDGISYFYAEVRRLRALLAALEDPDPRPVLYLIDEIFRGTNNRERLIGSRAYLRALAQRAGSGLVSTHDLELVELADALPALRNMHFRETIADGKMMFDYVLRPGPSPTTNALTVMKLAGLPVDP